MRAIRVVLLTSLTMLVATTAFAYMAEGNAKGSVIVVGEDRIAVQTQEGGQITFEVSTVKDGDQQVKNQAQLAQIKTLKAGDAVQIHWGRDHADHYYIIELTGMMQPGKTPGARTGLVQGKVVTTGEGRIVVAAADGAQMTLEPAWTRRRDGKYGRDPDQSLFAEQCKTGDEIIAIWQLDEGTHYVMHGVARLDAPGQAAALVLTQAELRESAQQLNQLQDQVQALRGLVEQLLKAMPQPAAPQPEAPK